MWRVQNLEKRVACIPPARSTNTHTHACKQGTLTHFMLRKFEETGHGKCNTSSPRFPGPCAPQACSMQEYACNMHMHVRDMLCMILMGHALLGSYGTLLGTS